MPSSLRFGLVVIVLILAQSSRAQQISTILATPNIENLVKQPKWEIGTDLLWLIDKNTLPKYALLIRRKVGEHSALRLRGGYAKNTIQPHFPNDNNADEYSLIRLGYEYQKSLSIKSGVVKSLVYGGTDLFYRYQYTTFLVENTVTSPGQILAVRVKETTHDSGGACFIGFKYFLNPYLSLSAESSFQVSRLTFSEQGEALNFYSAISYTIPSYQFLPLNTINLSFHF